MMFILIKNVHLLAPEDMGIQDILMCNNKIIKVADKIDFEWEDLTVIDGTGKTALPGFIDQHVHIIGGGGEDGFRSLIRDIQMTDCIKSGVTTVIGLLGTDAHAKSVESLVGKTKALKEEGITAYCLTGSYAYPSTTLTGSVAKDITFIDEIIGVKIAISDHRSSNVSKEELARLATQARTAGFLAKKPGVVHMHTGRGKSGYKQVLEIVEETDIPIQQFRPTHVSSQSESAMEYAKKGGYLDFTSDTKSSDTAKGIAETLKRVPVEQVTLSSDSNGSFPMWNDKLEIIGMGVGKMTTLFDTIRKLHLECDIPLETAIRLITENVAKALQLFPRKGSIKKDADADIVLVDADLEIDTVIALGKAMMIEKKVVAKNYYNYKN